MKFIHPIYLLSEKDPVVNDIGEIERKYIERKVLAHKQSTRQSEFYQAQALGIKPEITFITRSFEYKNEEKLKSNGIVYRILRTYDKGNGTIEIICIGAVNNANST